MRPGSASLACYSSFCPSEEERGGSPDYVWHGCKVMRHILQSCRGAHIHGNWVSSRQAHSLDFLDRNGSEVFQNVGVHSVRSQSYLSNFCLFIFFGPFRTPTPLLWPSAVLKDSYLLSELNSTLPRGGCAIASAILRRILLALKQWEKNILSNYRNKRLLGWLLSGSST